MCTRVCVCLQTNPQYQKTCLICLSSKSYMLSCTIVRHWIVQRVLLVFYSHCYDFHVCSKITSTILLYFLSFSHSCYLLSGNCFNMRVQNILIHINELLHSFMQTYDTFAKVLQTISIVKLCFYVISSSICHLLTWIWKSSVRFDRCFITYFNYFIIHISF